MRVSKPHPDPQRVPATSRGVMRDGLPGNPTEPARRTQAIELVLARVGAFLAAKNDSGLARALKVNRQTLASWRRRGFVPYRVLAKLATDRNVSLDYFVLGRGGITGYGSRINPSLMEAISAELIAESQRAGPTVAKLFSSSLLSYYASLIYNRISNAQALGINVYEMIPDEVRYLVALEQRQQMATGPQPRTDIYTEEREHWKTLGISLGKGPLSHNAILDAVSEGRQGKHPGRP